MTVSRQIFNQLQQTEVQRKQREVSLRAQVGSDLVSACTRDRIPLPVLPFNLPRPVQTSVLNVIGFVITY